MFLQKCNGSITRHDDVGITGGMDLLKTVMAKAVAEMKITAESPWQRNALNLHFEVESRGMRLNENHGMLQDQTLGELDLTGNKPFNGNTWEK